jgi:hypothetical protein
LNAYNDEKGPFCTCTTQFSTSKSTLDESKLEFMLKKEFSNHKSKLNVILPSNIEKCIFYTFRKLMGSHTQSKNKPGISLPFNYLFYVYGSLFFCRNILNSYLCSTYIHVDKMSFFIVKCFSIHNSRRFFSFEILLYSWCFWWI